MRKLAYRAMLGIAFAVLFGLLMWMTEEKPPLPQEKQPAELYFTPTQSLIKESIDKANRSILIMIYSLTDPGIIQALNSKSEAGLKVEVISDSKASPNLARKLNPNVTLIRRKIPGLMHRKILVADAEQVWVGSANMTAESLRLHDNLIIGMNSPQLAQFIYAKAADLDGTLPHLDLTIGNQKAEFWFLPDDKRAVGAIKRLISQAKKTIRIAMFTWTRNDFAKAVIDAHRRGVKIEVALDRNSAQGASAKIVELLKENGIPVMQNRGAGLLHHKMMIIDDQILLNGSANWTKAAFTQNEDCFMILYDLTDEQKQTLNGLWEKTIMKIALLGHGKMGKMVEGIALKKNYTLVPIDEAEVCIDFSHPSVALEHIHTCAKKKKSLVMGTTGWYEHLEEARKIVEEAKIGFLYSPNFSIGVSLFMKVVEEAAKLVNAHPAYDVSLIEYHHNQKADSPSGTAKALAKSLIAHVERKTHEVCDNPNRPIQPHELHVSSIRCGHIPGNHQVIFDSPADTITISHEARNREGFAMGAVLAAERLKGKRGFFTFQEALKGC